VDGREGGGQALDQVVEITGEVGRAAGQVGQQ
jgi:hypothetical protein